MLGGGCCSNGETGISSCTLRDQPWKTGRSCGCENPKGALTRPGVREGFLDEGINQVGSQRMSRCEKTKSIPGRGNSLCKDL